ncbi:MAG: AarF/ABC1/UbiB kinase family protein [Bdellovibrionota bacterium]
MLAKHGFQNVLEKAKLGRFLLEKFSSEEHLEKYTAAERLRMSFEELGPTFIKLGQLLSTRPDLIPSDFANELKKLQDHVQPVPYSEIEKILHTKFSKFEDVFLSIEQKPLATASIAQVHSARLKNGDDVVIKVQRPGILKLINDDLNVLYFIANLLENSVPELKVYNPTSIVDEFFKTMDLETNFLIEANNIVRFQKNFETDDTIKIPQVYFEHSNEQVIVMELIKGVTLSQPQSLKQEGVEPLEVVKKGMKIFFKMVFQDRFFHGDLHAGNIFILPNNKFGLVDFGVVGRLSVKTRDSIANMFIALAQEDYDALASEFVNLSQSTHLANSDVFAIELRDLIAPYFGLTFKNVNTGKLLMDAAALAGKHQIQVPSELMLFFKSIITVEGMGRDIVEDFDVLSQTLEIATEIIKAKYDPQRIMRDLTHVLKDSVTLFKDLPRQLSYSIKKKNMPNQAQLVKIEDLQEIKKTFEIASNLIFLGVVIGSLVLAGAIALDKQAVPLVFDMGLVSTVCFGTAIFLGLIAFYNFMKK